MTAYFIFFHYFALHQVCLSDKLVGLSDEALCP